MIDIVFKIALICKRSVTFVFHAVFITFASARHVLPIVLTVYGSSVFAEAIHVPSLIKAAFVEPREVLTKLNDTSFQSGEFGFKNINNPDGVCRPLDGRRIETSKFASDSGSEHSSGRNATSATFAPQLKPMRNNPSKTDAGNTKKPQVGGSKISTEKVHPSIWLLLAAIIISLCNVR